MYDVMEFLQNYSIPYAESGKNVKDGNVNIKCPFCSDDPSEHLGIEISSGRFGCWRDSSHRGNNFIRVVVELLNCSYSEAKELLRNTDIIQGDLGEFIDNCFAPPKPIIEDINSPSSLCLLDTFHKIDATGFRKRYYDYFKYKRGFLGTESKLQRFIDRFNIHCCPEGNWVGRLIFPLYINSELITWQSRSIRMDTELKYKDLSLEESVKHIKQCIYNYDELKNGGKVLYVTEGVFDCLKLLYYLPEGYSSTCLFTKTIQLNQISLLQKVGKGFDKVVLLLDNDAWGSMLTVHEQLSCIGNLSVAYLDDDINDPGEMTEEQILELVRSS